MQSVSGGVSGRFRELRKKSTFSFFFVYISYIFRSETHWVTLSGKSGQSTGQPSAKRCQICWKLSVRWLFCVSTASRGCSRIRHKGLVAMFGHSFRVGALTFSQNMWTDRMYRNIPFVTTSCSTIAFCYCCNFGPYDLTDQ